MSNFCVDISDLTPEQMKEFNNLMAEMQDATFDYIQELAEKLGISTEAAMNIHYLRSRSRHTQEKEDAIIRADQADKKLPPCYEDFNPEDY